MMYIEGKQACLCTLIYEGCDIHVGRLKRHNPTWRTSYTLGSHNNYIKWKCRFCKVNTMAKFKVNQLFFSSFIKFTSFWTLQCHKFVNEKALKMLFRAFSFIKRGVFRKRDRDCDWNWPATEQINYQTKL